MEWLLDPNAWIGLVTLIILEIVLGIDNLIFIAILANKLPVKQRNKARILGLSCALIMRLILLLTIFWVASLQQVIFSIQGIDVTIRGLIMIAGGIFLLAKSTIELHERLEPDSEDDKESSATQAVFWQVIVQIVILDIIFSLDSVITAVGMVQYVSIMVIAMLIAVAVMMWSSKFLVEFISKHPTVVILCLGFLMLIGFSLIIEGIGFHVPKGYLYFAIGFSIMVELFNQISRRKQKKYLTASNLRARTASTVLRMLGASNTVAVKDNVDLIVQQTTEQEVFQPEEKHMIQSVLELAERPIRSIMSPRNEVEWLDLNESLDEIKQTIYELKHSRIILAKDKIDEFIGIALVKDLLKQLSQEGNINWVNITKKPLVLHENTSVLRVMELLKGSPLQLAVIVDEHGSFEGIVTPTDLLEAIAGNFPEDEELPALIEEADGSQIVDGFADIRWISSILNVNLVDESDRYATLAGYILWKLAHLPVAGETFEDKGYRFKILSMEKRNIAKVHISKLKEQ
ncbi:TerC family protein [Bartonella sp. DGB1]|uniref:TerC family protein n=1 Tax=Bartonella sp. DGB1 TaxID=3239807 RepID=UPI003526009D